MLHLNIEIKARCPDAGSVRRYLQDNHADYKGQDVQTDTYFNTRKGRLKLREGNIENNLIYYERPDLAGPKPSQFQLVKTGDAKELKAVLEKSMGVKVIVRKKREIYYIRNVKFHIDEVAGLGSFVEIEAGNTAAGQLREQCDFYIKELGIRPEDLLDMSYSDMLIKKKEDQQKNL